MDNSPDHSLAPEPSDRKALFSALGWLGVIFIFALIVLISWPQNSGKDLEEEHVAARLAIKNQVNSVQHDLATTYGWANQSEGIVRLPITRAKELVIAELQAAGGQE